jgi:predicted alpha/beta superfamily hydrolase
MDTMLKKVFFALILMVIVSPSAYSQDIDSKELNSKESDNIVGEKFTISSNILTENRDIQIFLPESYHTSQQRYPVLYILDGQRLFTLGVSLSQSFRSTVKMSPEFIVVGINNKYPDRFDHFTKIEFLDFIEQELISTVDKNYRTTDERILFGWEFAGAYAIESLIRKPTLFSGHIAASPYPIDETWFAEKSRLEQLEGKFKHKLKSHLYITVSEGEGSVFAGTQKLNTLLKEKSPDSLRWSYRVIPDEEHLSTAHASLFQGLKNYFYAYKEFHIEGLEQFQQAGGLNNFYAYNKMRSQRFGFAEEPEIWSMFTIVRNAIRADDFEQFTLFMNEFKSSDLITKISLRNSNLIAQYYIQYKQNNKAIEVYKIMAIAHPDNARIQHEFGNIYLSMNNKKSAKVYYQKAVDLAKKSKDKKLIEYQKDLNKM